VKLVFLDESGTKDDPVSVTAGIVVDEYRVHSTKREWLQLLANQSQLMGRTVSEFHMTHVYGGREEWRGIADTVRTQAVIDVLSWVADKGHKVVFSASLNAPFDGRIQQACPMALELDSRWVSQGFHIALAVNKAFRREPRNKGKSILVFDTGTAYEQKLASLLATPPSWSDRYYDKARREQQLVAIMDTSFFADSTHAPLIQVADTVAFVLRRMAEIRDLADPERYPGEGQRIESWLALLAPAMRPVSNRYKRTGRDPSADLFWDIAPPSLRELR
jgi:hypothetical protein